MSADEQNKQDPRRKPRRRFPNRRPRNPNQKRENQQPQQQQSKSPFRKISIVVPLFNEEESLRPLTDAIKKSIAKINTGFELVFVDDGSTDRSLSIIRDLARQDNRIKYVSFKKNYGKSAALQVGFKKTTGDVVITMDADLQDDPDEIPNLLNKLSEGYDVVSGWKKKRFDPIIKKTSSKFFNYVTRLMSGIKIHDFNCGLKAYRYFVVKRLNVYGELHRYIPVLAKWEGFTISEVPVNHHPRRYGKTKFGISRFFKGFIDLITVIFTTRYVKRPMHLFGFIGAMFFLFGIIINAYLSYEWYMGVPLKDRPLLFLGILLIIVGAQFFAVGLLGELFAHSFKDDSEYNIKEQK